MKVSRLFGAAVVLSAALAGPAMARDVHKSGRCAQVYPNANCQNVGSYTGNDQRRTGYRDSYNRWDSDRNSDVASAAVGTAVGITTVPIGGDAYARNNGFVCIPGTWFRGEDGRRHICQ
jgi:hypothetical protein